MSPNVGGIDRIFRAIIGLVLIALPFVSGMALFDSGLFKWGAVVVGLVMLVVSMTKICPLYSILGIRTCPLNK